MRQVLYAVTLCGLLLGSLTHAQSRSWQLEQDVFAAIDAHNVEDFKKVLKAGVNVNATDESRNSLLLRVAETFPEFVPRSIALGADVNYRNEWNSQTPLLESVLQRNATNVRALLKAGATLTPEEHKWAKNIIASVPDAEIALLLGFPTETDEGQPIDQHDWFPWARDTKFANGVCGDFIQLLRDINPAGLYAIFTSGEFDPNYSREDVLATLDDFIASNSSANFGQHTPAEKRLNSAWFSDNEYIEIGVYRETPVFCITVTTY